MENLGLRAVSCMIWCNRSARNWLLLGPRVCGNLGRRSAAPDQVGRWALSLWLCIAGSWICSDPARGAMSGLDANLPSPNSTFVMTSDSLADSAKVRTYQALLDSAPRAIRRNPTLGLMYISSGALESEGAGWECMAFAAESFRVFGNRDTVRARVTYSGCLDDQVQATREAIELVRGADGRWCVAKVWQSWQCSQDRYDTPFHIKRCPY